MTQAEKHVESISDAHIMKFIDPTDVGDLFDSNNFYKYEKIEIKRENSKTIPNQVLNFSKEIQQIIRNYYFEQNILDHMKIEDIESFYDKIDDHLKGNYDNIKQFVLNCFSFSNYRNSIDLITELLTKFLSTCDNNYNILFKKAIIESSTMYSVISNFHFVIRNLCERGFFNFENDFKQRIKSMNEIYCSGRNINYYGGGTIGMIHKFQKFYVSNDESIIEIIKKDDLDEFVKLIYCDLSPDKKLDFKINIRPETAYMWENFRTEASLISIAAYYSSMKIFKYLFMILDLKQIESIVIEYSILGGNIEIFRLLLQKFNYNGQESSIITLKLAITFHRNEIADWLYENLSAKDKRKLYDILKCCIKAQNIDAFLKYISYKKCNKTRNLICYAIRVQSYVMYKILKWINSDMYVNEKLELALVYNSQPMIKYILLHYQEKISINQLLDNYLAFFLPYSECKAIVSFLNTIDQTYCFGESITDNLYSNKKLTTNFYLNVIGFGLDLNRIQCTYYGNRRTFIISLLTSSISLESNEIFKLIVSKPGIDVNGGQISPLLMSAMENNVEAFEILFNHQEINITKDEIKNIIQTNKSDEIVEIIKNCKQIEQILYTVIDEMLEYCFKTEIISHFNMIEQYNSSVILKYISKDFVSSNGNSLLVELIINFRCSDNLKIIKQLVNDGFIYVNTCHTCLIDFFTSKKVGIGLKKHLLSLEGFSALDIMEYGSNERIYSVYAHRLLNLSEINVDSIFKKIGLKAIESRNSKRANSVFFKALHHMNLSISSAIDAFYFAATNITNQNLMIVEQLYLKYEIEVIEDGKIYNFIKEIIKNAVLSLNKAVNFLIFKFIINHNLYEYENLVHYFKQLCCIYLSPSKLLFLLSKIKKTDFEFCVSLAVDVLIMNIEKVKNYQKYRFLFYRALVDYEKTGIFTKIWKLKNKKVADYYIYHIFKKKGTSMNLYFQDTVLHAAIKYHMNMFVKILCSYEEMKLKNGGKTLLLCKSCNNKFAYHFITKKIIKC